MGRADAAVSEGDRHWNVVDTRLCTVAQEHQEGLVSHVLRPVVRKFEQELVGALAVLIAVAVGELAAVPINSERDLDLVRVYQLRQLVFVLDTRFDNPRRKHMATNSLERELNLWLWGHRSENFGQLNGDLEGN